MKKQYIIAFTGLFEHGYVILSPLVLKCNDRKYNSVYDAKKDATRFRFKFMANFTCWLLNNNSANVLREFTVIECDVPLKNKEI